MERGSRHGTWREGSGLAARRWGSRHTVHHRRHALTKDVQYLAGTPQGLQPGRDGVEGCGGGQQACRGGQAWVGAEGVHEFKGRARNPKP